MIDVGLRVQWRRGDPQPLGAARDRRIVDRLDIDAVFVEQTVADLLAQHGIATITGTIWLALSQCGMPAASSRRRSLATRSAAASRSAELAFRCRMLATPRRRRPAAARW